VNVIILPLTFLILLLTDGLVSPAILALAPWAAAITIVTFLIAFICQISALARIEAGSAGLIYCLEPVIAALCAAMVLGERLGVLQYVGAGIVMIVVVANLLHERRMDEKRADAKRIANPANS
jgi:drug/metabolite transporter (DMT)-like permease